MMGPLHVVHAPRPTLLVLLALLVGSCGPTAAQVRTRYAAEVETCLENERAIVAREGTTLDEDRAALVAERARCDAALDAIRESCGRRCR